MNYMADEATYEALRRRAFTARVSMQVLIDTAVQKLLVGEAR
jgi:hypothetical protein